MPPRTQLTEDELEEIRTLRGQMSAKDIQKKFGIGAPRLYKIWRESAPPSVQEDTVGATIDTELNRIDVPNTGRRELDRLDIPVQSNAEQQPTSNLQTQLLFQIQNTLQNIDNTSTKYW